MSAKDKFSQHEALHMASVLTEIVNDQLLDHPWIQLHPRIAADVKKIVKNLNDVYQRIGALE